MKKLILSAAFLAIGTFAMAQQGKKMDKMNPAQMEQKRAEKLQSLKTELNLSDAQVVQIKALQDKRMAERQENAPRLQAERKAKIDAMKAKKEQHQSEMKQILTPEQYQKWEAKKKDNFQHKKGKMLNQQKIQKSKK